jgi:hypothetical protein
MDLPEDVWDWLSPVRRLIGYMVFWYGPLTFYIQFQPTSPVGHSPIEQAADWIPVWFVEQQRPLRPPVTRSQGDRPLRQQAAVLGSRRRRARAATELRGTHSPPSLPSCHAPFRRSLVRKPYLACPLPRLVLTVILPPSYGTRMG